MSQNIQIKQEFKRLLKLTLGAAQAFPIKPLLPVRSHFGPEQWSHEMNIFDEIEEDNKRAELICWHAKQILLPQWMDIAYALDRLEDEAAESAGIEREGNPHYRRNHGYQAMLRRLRKEFPGLLGFHAKISRQLLWLVLHGSQISRWHESLPDADKPKLTSPLMIKKCYEADRGVAKV